MRRSPKPNLESRIGENFLLKELGKPAMVPHVLLEPTHLGAHHHCAMCNGCISDYTGNDDFDDDIVVDEDDDAEMKKLIHKFLMMNQSFIVMITM